MCVDPQFYIFEFIAFFFPSLFLLREFQYIYNSELCGIRQYSLVRYVGTYYTIFVANSRLPHFNILSMVNGVTYSIAHPTTK